MFLPGCLIHLEGTLRLGACRLHPAWLTGVVPGRGNRDKARSCHSTSHWKADLSLGARPPFFLDLRSRDDPDRAGNCPTSVCMSGPALLDPSCHAFVQRRDRFHKCLGWRLEAHTGGGGMRLGAFASSCIAGRSSRP